MSFVTNHGLSGVNEEARLRQLALEVKDYCNRPALHQQSVVLRIAREFRYFNEHYANDKQIVTLFKMFDFCLDFEHSEDPEIAEIVRTLKLGH